MGLGHRFGGRREGEGCVSCGWPLLSRVEGGEGHGTDDLIGVGQKIPDWLTKVLSQELQQLLLDQELDPGSVSWAFGTSDAILGL